ncbi:hypothetical protein K438DRAFT_2101044 [Mycena galopus ATCC 62051]|nr:hypothetical protein K438DRAFT_2101044 [Mycena galopus ATCC 62051]
MHFFGVGILLGLLTASALASPAATKVLTPGGYRLSTDVYEVPAGGRVAHVGNDVHLIGADGTVLYVAPNVTTAATPAVESPPPEQSGWITYASWLNTSPSPISNFSTTYTVPAPPNTYHGQTVYLFNSIEPSTFDAILQPVLQYGVSPAGGGQYWSVATWYLYGPLVFYTPLVQVRIGQPLNGLISLVGATGSTYSYTAQYSNIPGTLLRTDNVEELTWASETLEAYGITAASDYPPGASAFYEINLRFAGPAPTVSWSVTNSEADGPFTTINRDGAFQGVLTITESRIQCMQNLTVKEAGAKKCELPDKNTTNRIVRFAPFMKAVLMLHVNNSSTVKLEEVLLG